MSLKLYLKAIFLDENLLPEDEFERAYNSLKSLKVTKKTCEIVEK